MKLAWYRFVVLTLMRLLIWSGRRLYHVWAVHVPEGRTIPTSIHFACGQEAMGNGCRFVLDELEREEDR